MREQNIENYNCEECTKRFKFFFENFYPSPEKAQNYTSVILSLCYASMITIFSSIHKLLNNYNKGLFLLFLLISLFFFIINEIWKMVLSQKLNSKMLELWKQYCENKITLSDLEKAKCEYSLSIHKWYYKFYPFDFHITLALGIIAFCVLLYQGLCLIF